MTGLLFILDSRPDHVQKICTPILTDNMLTPQHSLRAKCSVWCPLNSPRDWRQFCHETDVGNKLKLRIEYCTFVDCESYTITQCFDEQSVTWTLSKSFLSACHLITSSSREQRKRPYRCASPSVQLVSDHVMSLKIYMTHSIDTVLNTTLRQ